MTPTNTHESLNRLRKSLAIADTLQALGMTADFAAVRSPQERIMIAKLAGQLAPLESWEVAVQLLRDREATMDKFAGEREMLHA